MSPNPPQNNATKAKPKETAATSQIDASKLKKTGQLTPEEVAAYLLLGGFPADPVIISEGIGCVKAENSFMLPNNAQGPGGHIGMWSMEPGFGSVSEREDPLRATELAYENWKSNGNSFYQAWGQWQEEQGGLPGGGAKVYGPEYLKTAESVIKKGVTGANPGTTEGTAEGTGGVSGQVSIAAVEAAAKGAAFSAYLNLPGLFEGVESENLKGKRSLMNDQALFGFIEQLSTSSLRRFQSLPNGNFFAFYPDYFGGMNHRTPYWEIHDIEILDGTINLSDDALATHVYVVGDTIGWFDGVTTEDKAQASGVITLFHALAANFITGLGEEADKDASKKTQEKRSIENRQQAINFLKKYGARPYYEEVPMVRSAYYEMFLAFQRFCTLWSKQFLAEFKLTYMPELFPGGLVSLPEHGLQLFIEEVSHEFDYEQGFSTNVIFSSPTNLKNGPEGFHDGMIRSDALSPQA